MTNPILVVGSGNAENILTLKGDIVLGNKHSVEIHELLGGSGVNFSLRLLSAGIGVLPILTIGNDRLGEDIRQQLCAIAAQNKVQPVVTEFLNSAHTQRFFDPRITTPSSTVIVNGTRRTIFSQRVNGIEHFIDHLKQRIRDVETLLEGYPSAVMIGHLHSDGLDSNPKDHGRCTKAIIDAFQGKSLIYANLGNSQLQLGYEFWEHSFQHIDILQLNIAEAKQFFTRANEPRKALLDILEMLLANRMTAVITIERFGAIGIHKDNTKALVLAWPLIEINDIIDTTGAGDAFAAGMVSRLAGDTKFSFQDFLEAMERASFWSAYACTTLGGSGNCPDKRELEQFYQENSAIGKKTVETRDKRSAEEFIKLIDVIITKGTAGF